MKKEIFIIRHGETDMNRLGIVQGSGVDSSLNQTGHKQANAFYNAYKKIGFDLVICSALQRTQQTVKPFIDDGLPFLQTPDINEICWGIHEGRTPEPWMKTAYAEMRDQWIAGNLDARLEKGESAREMMDRLTRFLESLKPREEQKILVCSHGRAMRCMIALMKKVAMSEMEKVNHANTGLFLADFDGNNFKITIENDTSHLGGIHFLKTKIK